MRYGTQVVGLIQLTLLFNFASTANTESHDMSDYFEDGMGNGIAPIFTNYE